jgi:hypothetical protein
LGNIEGQSGGFEPKELGEMIEEYKCQVSSSYLESKGNIRSGIIWWYLLGGPSIKSLRVQALERRKEWPRLYRLLRVIDKQKKWNKKDFFTMLDVRVSYRVPEELVKLCNLGFNKSQALELYNIDVKEYSDLQPHLGQIECLENPNLFVAVNKVLEEYRPNQKRHIGPVSIGDDE